MVPSGRRLDLPLSPGAAPHAPACRTRYRRVWGRRTAVTAPRSAGQLSPTWNAGPGRQPHPRSSPPRRRGHLGSSTDQGPLRAVRNGGAPNPGAREIEPAG